MSYRLTGFNDLAKIYQVFGNQLNDFFNFYWSFREAGADNKK
jgi:hypothetical protein